MGARAHTHPHTHTHTHARAWIASLVDVSGTWTGGVKEPGQNVGARKQVFQFGAQKCCSCCAHAQLQKGRAIAAAVASRQGGH
eukprot:115447-Amphidinium_carterae.1